MRKWFSLAACLLALVWVGAARADTPPDVYTDYAEDGVLSCGYSRAVLKGVLTDASIHQYGDPLTFLGLKLAVRKQLAGGCRREASARETDGSPVGGTVSGTSSDSGPGGGAANSARKSERSRPRPAQPPEEGEEEALPDRNALGDGESSSVRDGRMTLLGILLLLLTLGSGGWAARRAFSDRA